MFGKSLKKIVISWKKYPAIKKHFLKNLVVKLAKKKINFFSGPSFINNKRKFLINLVIKNCDRKVIKKEYRKYLQKKLNAIINKSSTTRFSKELRKKGPTINLKHLPNVSSLKYSWDPFQKRGAYIINKNSAYLLDFFFDYWVDRSYSLKLDLIAKKDNSHKCKNLTILPKKLLYTPFNPLCYLKKSSQVEKKLKNCKKNAAAILQLLYSGAPRHLFNLVSLSHSIGLLKKWYFTKECVAWLRSPAVALGYINIDSRTKRIHDRFMLRWVSRLETICFNAKKNVIKKKSRYTNLGLHSLFISKLSTVNYLTQLEQNYFKDVPLLKKLIILLPDQQLGLTLYYLLKLDLFKKFFASNVITKDLKNVEKLKWSVGALKLWLRRSIMEFISDYYVSMSHKKWIHIAFFLKPLHTKNSSLNLPRIGYISTHLTKDYATKLEIIDKDSVIDVAIFKKEISNFNEFKTIKVDDSKFIKLFSRKRVAEQESDISTVIQIIPINNYLYYDRTSKTNYYRQLKNNFLLLRNKINLKVKKSNFKHKFLVPTKQKLQKLVSFDRNKRYMFIVDNKKIVHFWDESPTGYSMDFQRNYRRYFFFTSRSIKNNRRNYMLYRAIRETMTLKWNKHILVCKHLVGSLRWLPALSVPLSEVNNFWVFRNFHKWRLNSRKVVYSKWLEKFRKINKKILTHLNKHEKRYSQYKYSYKKSFLYSRAGLFLLAHNAHAMIYIASMLLIKTNYVSIKNSTSTLESNINKMLFFTSFEIEKWNKPNRLLLDNGIVSIYGTILQKPRFLITHFQKFFYIKRLKIFMLWRRKWNNIMYFIENKLDIAKVIAPYSHLLSNTRQFRGLYNVTIKNNTIFVFLLSRNKNYIWINILQNIINCADNKTSYSGLLPRIKIKNQLLLKNKKKLTLKKKLNKSKPIKLFKKIIWRNYIDNINSFYSSTVPLYTGTMPGYNKAGLKDLKRLISLIGATAIRVLYKKRKKRYFFKLRHYLSKKYKKKIPSYRLRYKRRYRRLARFRLNKKLFHMNIILKRLLFKLYCYRFSLIYLYARYKKNNFHFNNIQPFYFIARKKYVFNWHATYAQLHRTIHGPINYKSKIVKRNLVRNKLSNILYLSKFKKKFIYNKLINASI